MNPFLPATPEPRDFNSPLVDLSERAVTQWLEALPLQRAADAIPLLRKAIDDLNFEPLIPKRRCELLERYHAPVVGLLEERERWEPQLAELETQQQQALHEAFAATLWALAGGYKIIVRDGRDGERDPRRDNPLKLALYRAVELLGATLLDTFRRYAAAPPHLYRELHQLYRYAVESGVADDPLQLDRHRESEHTTALLYKRAMLLAAADPFRMPAGTVGKLHHLLTPFAGHCTLEKPQWGDPGGRFLIDPTADRPPLPCARADAANVPPDHWLLETAALRQSLAEHLTKHRDAEQDLALLQRLLPDLKMPPRRRAPRRTVSGELRIAVGLEATHHFLSHPGRERLKSAPASSPYGIEVHDDNAETLDEFLLEPWRIVNESDQGYQLARRHALNEALKVGELIGLFAPESDAAPTEIGIVRWIRRGREGWTHAGIQRLAGRVAAVDCAPQDPAEAPFDETRALYMVSPPGVSIPPTLLSRRPLYRRGGGLQLRRETKTGYAATGSLLLETDHIVRFTLRPPQRTAAEG